MQAEATHGSNNQRIRAKTTLNEVRTEASLIGRWRLITLREKVLMGHFGRQVTWQIRKAGPFSQTPIFFFYVHSCQPTLFNSLLELNYESSPSYVPIFHLYSIHLNSSHGALSFKDATGTQVKGTYATQVQVHMLQLHMLPTGTHVTGTHL